jgi:hypothetical protein
MAVARPSLVPGTVEATHKASMRASTSREGSHVRGLVDGRDETFWQSEGTLPHHIVIQFDQLTPITVPRK